MLCNYRNCKVEADEHNEGNLWLQWFGSYGDFKDNLAMENENDNEIILCHKHAHKVFNLIYGYNNYGSTSHSGREPGYWFGHPRWERVNIVTLLIMLFRNPRLIKYEWKELLWLSKKDIHDKQSKWTYKNIIKNLFKFN